MLADLIKQGFGEDENLNCAETILRGANIAYNLDLDKDAVKLASGFGGGMAIGDKCGTLTASIMVLGRMFVNKNAQESKKMEELTKELFNEYKEKMGSVDCLPLREMHETKELKCNPVKLKTAEILDDIINREINKG